MFGIILFLITVIRHNLEDLQSNSVITNSMGPSVSVSYNREIVITMKIYVVK